MTPLPAVQTSPIIKGKTDMTPNQVLPIASLLLGSCFAIAQQAPPPPATPVPPDSPVARAHAKTIHDSRNIQYRVITAGEPGPRSDLRIAPPGMWWKNPDLAQKISLTADQQKRMDDIFQQSRIQLIDLKANVEKQEVLLEPMLSANPPDTNKVLGQIDHVASARAELEKANARMLLGIRGVLSADQWTKLQAEQRENQRFMFRYKTGPGGPGGPGVLRRRLHVVNGFGEVEEIFADYLRWFEERSVESDLFEGVDTADLEPAEA